MSGVCTCDPNRPGDAHEPDCIFGRDPHSLLRKRLEWEAAHPRPEPLRRAERAIVRGLAAEFGKGQQHQVTHETGFEIAIEGLIITVKLEETP